MPYIGQTLFFISCLLIIVSILNIKHIKSEDWQRIINNTYDTCYYARDGFLVNASKLHPDDVSETVLEAKKIIEDIGGVEISASQFDYILAKNFLKVRGAYLELKEEVDV